MSTSRTFEIIIACDGNIILKDTSGTGYNTSYITAGDLDHIIEQLETSVTKWVERLRYDSNRYATVQDAEKTYKKENEAP